MFRYINDYGEEEIEKAEEILINSGSGWHNLRIEMSDAKKVMFYLDDESLYTSINALPPEYSGSAALGLGKRLCYHDNVQVVAGNDNDEGQICDDRYDEGYEAGKQYCINNPSACGWLGGYTQSDLDNARQEGYNSGCNDCSNGSSSPATISPELKLHIPTLQYQGPFGAMDLWADFEFAGENNGDMLWKLSDFGQK